jgi:serine phosphatase RsbU (regulator of sigma subunit)/FixJ family two-component response regulator
VVKNADVGKAMRTTPRTLIADDQPDVLTALRLLLKGEGYQIEAAMSPSAVLEALSTNEFDLLLMDLNYARDTTSGQEGLDLLAEIQKVDDTLPIVVMTGWGSIELAVEAMRRGVRDFVQKPWDNSKLLSILRTQVQHGITLRKKRRLENQNKAFAAKLLEVKDLHSLQHLSLMHFQTGLRCSPTVFFSKISAEQAYCATVEISDSEPVAGRFRIRAQSQLAEFVSARTDHTGDPRQLPLLEDEKVLLKQNGIVRLIPVQHSEDLVGFIGVGRNPLGEDYDSEELKFMAEAGTHIAAGLDSLRLRGQDREMEEAQEIQKKLMPKEIPQIHGFELSGAWRPASVVSGDYFDVLKFDESQMALCIADVAGKGMPAALLMSNVQAAVKALAGAHVLPHEMCEKLNRVVCSNTSHNKFITFFYGQLDARERRFSYANAGHNPPILVRQDGQAMRLSEGGAVLGVFPNWVCQSSQIELASGDRILLFTDGVTEVINTSGEEFGEERLIALLTEHRTEQAPQLQKTIMNAVAEFSNGNFLDDATIILMAVS